VTLTGGVNYTIDVRGEPTDNGTLGDPYLQVRDATGAILDENDDGPEGLNSQIVFRAPATGTYYQVVREAFDGNSGTYEISIR
jgi:hypothetical protein